jgi:hypothetical protein
MSAIHSIRVTQKQYKTAYVDMEFYIVMQRREEDNIYIYIYEGSNETIYRISSKAHEYCSISSDHMISVSKLQPTLTP